MLEKVRTIIVQMVQQQTYTMVEESGHTEILQELLQKLQS